MDIGPESCQRDVPKSRSLQWAGLALWPASQLHRSFIECPLSQGVRTLGGTRRIFPSASTISAAGAGRRRDADQPGDRASHSVEHEPSEQKATSLEQEAMPLIKYLSNRERTEQCW